MATLRDKLEGVKAALRRAYDHTQQRFDGRTEAWEHIESAIPKMAKAYSLMPEILSDVILLQAQADSASSMMFDLQQQYIALNQDYKHLCVVFQEWLDLHDANIPVDAAVQEVHDFWRRWPEED